ncbi:Iron-sulfur cluster carrier protein [termite gut metagenome]|uniref:Iron-sulfur cluster carrier protein n=1 Tax=termite gut metagenome TaxID=433724 RepID=A0A5J4QH18_9ZZZZ
MKQPLFIAFSTQKGGVGKTTFSTLAASYLHYVKDFNVAVIDCDYPQWSIHSMRKREAEQLQTNTYYQNKAVALFESLGKGTYPVICTNPDNDIFARAKEFLLQESTTYDILLFDLPGTINNRGVIETFLAMDYVFVPISASRLAMESTLPFIISVNEMKTMYPAINLKDVFLFWNMVVPRSKKELYDHYESIINRFGIPMLKTTIPRSIRYDTEQSIVGNAPVFLSTIFPPDKILLKDSNLDLLIDEILGIIDIQK